MPIPIRPNVLGMQPYSPGKPIDEVKRELGLDRVAKLASNENPLGPSPMAVEAMRAALDSIHIYPDGAAFELRQALVAAHGLPANQLVLSNGSDQIIELLAWVLIQSSEDEIITATPSFARYRTAAMLAPCKLIEVPLDSELKIDLVALAAHLSARTRLIYLANPNNPTGTFFGSEEFATFMAQVSPDCLVVLDEAYAEFAQEEPTFPNGLEWVKKFPNLGTLRTFSKAYGLAGIRLGYGWLPAEVAGAIERVRVPFNCNSLAQVAGVAALKDKEHLQKSVAHNTAMLTRLDEAFRAIGARTYASRANFVLGDLGRPADSVFQALLRKGIIVRPGHVLGLPNTLRVSVGTTEEVEWFARELVVAQG